MYKFRDEFPYEEYRENLINDLGELIIEKDEAIRLIIFTSKMNYESRQTLLNKPLFNSKDYLETIKRKDR